MRVALACERFGGRSGGAAFWSRALAQGLAERGWDVAVFAFAPDGEPVGRRDELGLDVTRLPWHPSRVARARAISAEVDRSRADVVHDSGAGWSFDVFQPQTGSRALNHRRDMESRTSIERLRERGRPRYWRWRHELRRVEARQFARGDGVFVAVSTMVARSMESLHGVPADRIRVVPNGIEVDLPDAAARQAARADLRGRLGLADDAPLFLFPALNLRLKGVRPLVEAAALLRPRLSRFAVAIVGGEADAGLRERIVDTGLERVVLPRGFVEDLAAYWSAADALVLPTFHDACSLSVFEACAFGLPVITTRRNGAAEHLVEGRHGFVLDDPADAAALAERMLLLADPARRRRMSPETLDLARRHSMSRNVDALEVVLTEAARHRPVRPRGTGGSP